MDPLLAASRLPALADRAVRDTFVATLASRRRSALPALVREALLRFERSVALKAPNGVRPSLLFAQRDRILRAIRRLWGAEVTARLFWIHRRDIVASGTSARPFDLIVRARDGALYAVVWRALPTDGRRLERLRAARIWAKRGHRTGTLAGIVIVDLQTGLARVVTVNGLRPGARAA
jgi:hypothetical protein